MPSWAAGRCRGSRGAGGGGGGGGRGAPPGGPARARGLVGGGAPGGVPGLARLRAAYEHLLAFTLERAAQVVCVPPILPDDGVEGPFRSRVQEMTGMITDVVHGAPRARLFDLGGDVVVAKREDPWAQLTIDGVHLSARGAAVVADAFARVIVGTRPDESPRRGS
jgi:hypothetical protein